MFVPRGKDHAPSFVPSRVSVDFPYNVVVDFFVLYSFLSYTLFIVNAYKSIVSMTIA